MLARVGIADAERRMQSYPHELSGGMRQRVAIAAALLTDPGLLIADEPTTALDVTMEAQIIHLLRELRREYNGIIIVVSHHLGVIAELCDRVYVMYAGEVVEGGEVDAIFHDARHPYTQALLACDPARFHERLDRLPTIPGLAAQPDGAAGRMRLRAALRPCLRAVPARRAAAGEARRRPCRALPCGDAMSPLLAVEDLSVSFARGGLLNRLLNPFPLPGFNVIDGVTLSLMPGETLGLVGESGSGKTTLARAILGLVRAAAGRIAFEGRDVRDAGRFPRHAPAARR